MGNKISSAVGSEMNFMPQPQAVQQQGLQGVQGTQGSVDKGESNSYALASGFKDLNASWLDYFDAHDKRQEQIALQKATDMVNGASNADVQGLNSVDMAQTYGYATLTDNPYFTAYADKMIGHRNGAMLQSAYNDKYGGSPADSIDDEVKRYSQFAQDYRAKINPDSKGMNTTAFDAGFYTQNAQNIQALADTHAQRDVSDRLQETYQSTQSQLGSLVYNAPSLSMDNIKAQTQAIFNQTRLMGLSGQQRYALMDNFTKQFAATGTLKMGQLSDLMKNVQVETRLDGSYLSMADLSDSMSLDEYAQQYRKQHIDQVKINAIKKYGKNATMDNVTADTLKGQNSDSRAARDDAEIVESAFPQIQAAQAQHHALIARQTKAATKSAGNIIKQTAISSAVDSNIDAYMNGDMNVTDAYGNGIGHVSVQGSGAKDNDYLQGFFRKQNDILSSSADDATKETQMMKLWSYPGVNSVREQVQRRMLTTINGATEQDVLQNGAPDSIMHLLRMRQTGSAQFGGLFGADVDSAVATIQNNIDASGESDPDNAAIKGYAAYAKTHGYDKDTKDGLMTAYHGLTTNGYDIQNISTLGTEDGQNTLACTDPRIADIVQKRYLNYAVQERSNPESALQNAISDVQSNYAYYHGAIIPKNGFGSGLANEDTWAQQALDAYVYDFADGAGISGNNVSVDFNPNTREFTLTNDYDGTHKTIRMASMRNEMQWCAAGKPDYSSGDSDNTQYTVTPADNNSSSGAPESGTQENVDYANADHSAQGDYII